MILHKIGGDMRFWQKLHEEPCKVILVWKKTLNHAAFLLTRVLVCCYVRDARVDAEIH